MRATEIGEQLLVRRGLFEGIQLGAVEVLQQGLAQHVVVGGLAHDRGDAFEPGFLRRTPAALARDQLEVRAIA